MADRFGNYELIRRLAQGGMAEVYLARFSGVEGFERQVVIKRMLPELAGRKDFVDMFLDEARLAARFNHPNIVQVYELGEKAGSYFMSMEYVDGPHLGVLFAHSLRIKKALPLSLCAYVLARAAEGLHHAHELKDGSGQPLNIVHRDVSPQNILVSRDGDVKVMDFGVAKASANTTHTRTGVIKGKIGYMSPEQCLANPLDRRTDVFALGIVLYELVTRRRLFRDKSDLVVMQKITMEDVAPPSSVNPRIPPELDELIMRCLRRTLSERTASALQLSDELDTWLATQPETATRSNLTRWMRENAPDLGPGAGAGDANAQQPTPSWGPSSPSQGSRPGVSNPGVDAPTAAAVPDVDPSAPTRAAPSPRAALSAEETSTGDEEVYAQDRTPVDLPAAPVPPAAAPGGMGRAAAGGALLALLALGGGAFALWGGSSPGTGQAATSGPATTSAVSGSTPPVDPTPATSAPAGTAAPASTVAVVAPAASGAEVAPPAAPEKKLGSIKVLTDPVNAEVFVNKVSRGTCEKGPLLIEGLPLEPGEATVTVQLEGYDPYRGSVPLTAGETATMPVIRLRKYVPPKAGVGLFDITSEPSNLKVTVDGRSVGRTPLMRLEMKEGAHQLVVEAPAGYVPVKTSIKSVSGVKQSLPYVLEKKDRDASPPSQATPKDTPKDDGPKTLKVMVDTQPYWSYAYFNGRNLGPTPVGAELPVGKVTLRFKRDGKDGCSMDAARTVEINAANNKVKVLLDAREARGECL